MATIPTQGVVATDNQPLNYMLAGVHGAIKMLELASNGGARFGYQQKLEVTGAIARLHILLQSIEQGCKLGQVQGISQKLIDSAYPVRSRVTEASAKRGD